MDDPNRSGAAPLGAAQAAYAHHGSHAVFEEATALRRTGGDRKLLKQVIGLYRADAPSAVRKIVRAVSDQDPEALRIAAHTLKGSVATVGGASARYAAATLEDLGKAGKLTGADTAVAVLRAELAKLEKAFVSARLVQTKKRTTKAARGRSRAQAGKTGKRRRS